MCARCFVVNLKIVYTVWALERSRPFPTDWFIMCNRHFPCIPPVGAHNVRPLLCGESQDSNTAWASERSRPFSTDCFIMHNRYFPRIPAVGAHIVRPPLCGEWCGGLYGRRSIRFTSARPNACLMLCPLKFFAQPFFKKAGKDWLVGQRQSFSQVVMSRVTPGRTSMGTVSLLRKRHFLQKPSAFRSLAHTRRYRRLRPSPSASFWA